MVDALLLPVDKAKRQSKLSFLLYLLSIFEAVGKHVCALAVFEEEVQISAWTRKSDFSISIFSMFS